MKDQIFMIQADLKSLGIKATYPHKKNLEITLAFLGEKQEEDIKEIVDNLNLVKFEKFDIEIKDMGHFPNSYHINNIWLSIESDKLTKLQDLICKAIDFKMDRPFDPHITLCRIKEHKYMDNIRGYMAKNKNIKMGKFTAHSFVLKKSTLTKDGPKYENIEEFWLD